MRLDGIANLTRFISRVLIGAKQEGQLSTAATKVNTYLRLRADLFDFDTGCSNRNLGKYYFENYFGT